MELVDNVNKAVQLMCNKFDAPIASVPNYNMQKIDAIYSEHLLHLSGTFGSERDFSCQAKGISGQNFPIAGIVRCTQRSM